MAFACTEPWKRKPIGDGARLESGVSCDYAALGVRLDPASDTLNRLTSGEVTRLSIWSDGFDPRAVCQIAASPSGLRHLALNQAFVG